MRGRDRSIDKIKRSLKTVEEAGDKIVAVIVPQTQVLTDLPGIDGELWEKYLELVGGIKLGNKSQHDLLPEQKNCIYDPMGFLLDHVDKWAGYYGDAAPLVRECVSRGIPVMIENIDV